VSTTVAAASASNPNASSGRHSANAEFTANVGSLSDRGAGHGAATTSPDAQKRRDSARESVRSGARGYGQDRSVSAKSAMHRTRLSPNVMIQQRGEAVRTLTQVMGACRGASARPRRHPPRQRHVSGCFERLRFSARIILQRRRHPTARAAFSQVRQSVQHRRRAVEVRGKPVATGVRSAPGRARCALHRSDALRPRRRSARS
jgi:hypothetical protein